MGNNEITKNLHVPRTHFQTLFEFPEKELNFIPLACHVNRDVKPPRRILTEQR